MGPILILFWIVCLAVPSRGLAAVPDENAAENIFSNQSGAIATVVGVTRTNKSGKLGSGFVVSADGLIVTNYHIVQKAKKIFVKLRGDRVYNHVRLIGFDKIKDIAILKIDESGLKKVRLGDSRHVKVGQRVVTIGNPHGLENSVADGLISSRRHNEQGLEIFQISVPLSNGSSGGPLFDLDGDVIGITTASLAGGQNLNFAVPIEEARPLIETAARELKAKSRGATKTPRRWSDTYSVYQVRPKDTLYSLSKRFNTSIDQIMLINRLSTTRIFAGQKIKIPVIKTRSN